ncbi:MAG: hypothetical protein AB7L09_24600 [Nitrospira sp.]
MAERLYERKGRLADAVQGATKPSQEITWTREDGEPQNLIEATLSGVIRNKTTSRAIEGDLVVTDTDLGQFRWDFAAADVSIAGTFHVKFTASFPWQPDVKSYEALWVVRGSD